MQDWVAPGGSIELNFLGEHFGSAQIAATDASRCGGLAGWVAAARSSMPARLCILLPASLVLSLLSCQSSIAVAATPCHDWCVCRDQEGSGPCQQMTLDAYLAWWQQQQQQQQQQPTVPALAEGAGAAASAAPAGAPLLYCKDWHLVAEFPQYHAYTCPPFFQDDWLNEWLDHRQAQQAQQAQHQGQQRAQGEANVAASTTASTSASPSPSSSSSSTISDYRFVYLGPRGTCTPLHSDVLRSFSWSANVAGRKLWRLLPPQVRRRLAALQRLGRLAAPAAYQILQQLPSPVHKLTKAASAAPLPLLPLSLPP